MPMVLVDPAEPLGMPAPIAEAQSAYSHAKVLRRHPGDTAASLYEL